MSRTQGRRRVIRRSAEWCAVLVLLLGIGIRVAVAGAGDAPPTPIQWLDGIQYEYAVHADIEGVVDGTEAVAVVKVEAVTSPYFNSADGRYWSGNDQFPVDVYSDVHATVQDVWYGDPPPALSLREIGDASVRWEGSATGTAPPYEALSGGFTTGDLYVVLLRHVTLPFEQGPQDGWTLAADFEGNWRIDGDTAIDSDPRWTMSVADLKALLVSTLGTT